MLDQQRDPQRGTTGVQVHGPGHRIAFGQLQDVTEEFEQLGLVVPAPVG